MTTEQMKEHIRKQEIYIQVMQRQKFVAEKQLQDEISHTRAQNRYICKQMDEIRLLRSLLGATEADYNADVIRVIEQAERIANNKED